MDNKTRQAIGDKISNCVNRQSFTDQDMEEICQLFEHDKIRGYPKVVVQMGREKPMNDDEDYQPDEIQVKLSTDDLMLDEIEGYLLTPVQAILAWDRGYSEASIKGKPKKLTALRQVCLAQCSKISAIKDKEFRQFIVECCSMPIEELDRKYGAVTSWYILDRFDKWQAVKQQEVKGVK